MGAAILVASAEHIDPWGPVGPPFLRSIPLEVQMKAARAIAVWLLVVVVAVLVGADNLVFR